MKYICPNKLPMFMDIGKYIPKEDYRSRTYPILYTFAVAKNACGLKNKVNGYVKPSAEKQESWDNCVKFKNKHGGFGKKLYMLQRTCYEYCCAYKMSYEGRDYIVVFTRTNRFVVDYDEGGLTYAR